MSEQLYRINPNADDRDVFHAISLDPGEEPAMVPVERCVHGNIDRHITHTRTKGIDHEWCDGVLVRQEDT